MTSTQKTMDSPTQPDLFAVDTRPAPGVIVVNQWMVAETIALVDAKQREADERRFGASRFDAATLSLFDEPTDRVSRR